MRSVGIQFSLRSTVALAASTFAVGDCNKAMKLIKITVIVLVVIAMSCRGAIVIPTPSQDVSVSNLLEVVHIVTSCYGDRLNGIGVAGNLSGTLSRILTIQHLIPVVLFDTPDEFLMQPQAPVQFRQKLQVFIVDISVVVQVSNVIDNIRGTIWYNPMASFFILDRSPGCDPSTVLRAAVYMQSLHAKAICLDVFESEPLIFAQNPFVDQAPVPWKRYRVFPRGWQPGLTVFSRTYRRNESICLNLDFDKTNDGGGYRMTMEGYPPESLVPIRTKTNLAEYEHSIKTARILGILWRTMNVTPVFTFRERYSEPINEHMAVVPRTIFFTWRDCCLTTYSYDRFGFVLVSQFRGHKPQLTKILTVIDTRSRYGLGIVYLITLVFLKVFVRQALVPALLNLIRVTCNYGFTNLLDDNPTRIYLTALLFFVVTMQGIYQGNLASLLTTRIPLPNIDTMTNVIDFDCELYGTPEVKAVLDHPELQKRYVPVNLNACVMRAVENSSAVCMTVGVGRVLDKAREFGLHVNSEFIRPTYTGFRMRWGWFLEERVNAILARIVEADILEPWDVKCNPIKLTDFEFDKHVTNNQVVKKIELGELTFAFVILGIGLTCASVTLVVELAVGYKCRAVKRDVIN